MSIEQQQIDKITLDWKVTDNELTSLNEIWININDWLTEEEYNKLKDILTSQSKEKRDILLEWIQKSQEIKEDTKNKIDILNRQIQWETALNKLYSWDYTAIKTEEGRWELFDNFANLKMPAFMRNMILRFFSFMSNLPIIWDQLAQQMWYTNWKEMYDSVFMEINWRVSINYLNNSKDSISILKDKNLDNLNYKSLLPLFNTCKQNNISFYEKDFWPKLFKGQINIPDDYKEENGKKYKITKIFKIDELKETDFNPNNKTPNDSFLSKLNNPKIEETKTEITEEEWNDWQTKLKTKYNSSEVITEKSLKDIKILNSYKSEISKAVNTAKANKQRYEKVSAMTWIPWELIAAIHYREASFNFESYLHNGDPLWKTTTHVPKWKNFSNWEDAAADALWSKELNWNDFNNVLDYAERYNWLWYRNKWLNSPYVWAWTNKYEKWMYIADWQFSATKKDPRPWVAAIIMWLKWIA